MNRLVDRFGRAHTYLRISVTDRCNLRCFYCMPPEGIDWKPKDQILTFGEIETIARILVRLGINKIRLTGGEPLVRRDFDHLVSMLSRIEGLSTLAMTTNAIKLADNVAKLKQAGIKTLNISLDTLHADRFEKITGRDYHPRVMTAIEQSLAAGFQSLKLNVVVMGGVNDDEVLDFVEYAYDKPINVRFIEFMPFKNNSWEITKVITYKDMMDRISQRFNLAPMPAEIGAVAKDYAIEGGIGTVSFITSMSDSFCSTCNRLRLTADGSLKTCLFYPAEQNLRDLLRAGTSDAELERIIVETVLQKPEEHPPAEEIASQENRSMIEIGG
ncbi:MAG: GTP 3',8-cyclase MoaA [Cyanobacteria bacterium]|nr:GTP 3',8-cyclase MoaA [Cyanobacteriota bacterium]